VGGTFPLSTEGTETDAPAFEQRLKAQALGLGFDAAGIATLGPVDSHAAFTDWLARGYHGEMEYLQRGDDLRADTARPEPGMRSALVVTLDYGGKQPDGPVARYARGTDYHRVMWDRLDELLAWIRAERGANARGRAYVDTGPILERDLARKAGLGWLGKNTMLIHPERGSFFFIGALFLDLDLTPDAPFESEHCGTCTRCLDACPTRAFVEPGVMDARRCISYLTIEHRSQIPMEFHAAIGDHLYGCDICQDVCPWNLKFARADPDAALAPAAPVAGTDAITLAESILAMDEDAYRGAFRHSAMKRAQHTGLQRNARIVLRNAGRAIGATVMVGLAAACAAAMLSSATTTPLHAQQAPTRPDTTRRPAQVEAVIIAATRSERRIEDEPLHVEVIAGEEVEEELIMIPGDITMMLNQTPGLRVQGIRGRWTTDVWRPLDGRVFNIGVRY